VEERDGRACRDGGQAESEMLNGTGCRTNWCMPRSWSLSAGSLEAWAHDFNNLLTAILSYAELSLMKIPEMIRSGACDIDPGGEREGREPDPSVCWRSAVNRSWK